jgi:hypothetical protein
VSGGSLPDFWQTPGASGLEIAVLSKENSASAWLSRAKVCQTRAAIWFSGHFKKETMQSASAFSDVTKSHQRAANSHFKIIPSHLVEYEKET